MRMIRLAFLALVCTAAPASAQDAPPEAKAIGEILAAGAPPVIDIDAALGADAVAALKQLYTTRVDRPVWFTDAESPAAHALLDRLSQPDMTVGANVQPLLDAARVALPDVHARAGADLLLTALYGATARALRPKNAPMNFAAALDELAKAPDVAALLREPETPKVETPTVESPTVETPAVDPSKAETPKIESPPEPAPLARLRAAIATLEKSTDGPQVPDGPKLQLGDTGPRIEALSRRLIASGDLQAALPGSSFDP
jgi:murein L,D-transpeptidase YcbB/YkuD